MCQKVQIHIDVFVFAFLSRCNAKASTCPRLAMGSAWAARPATRFTLVTLWLVLSGVCGSSCPSTTHTPKAGESRNSQLHILTYLGIAALNNNHSFAKSANTFEFFRYLQVVPNEVCFLLWLASLWHVCSRRRGLRLCAVCWLECIGLITSAIGLVRFTHHCVSFIRLPPLDRLMEQIAQLCWRCLPHAQSNLCGWLRWWLLQRWYRSKRKGNWRCLYTMSRDLQLPGLECMGKFPQMNDVRFFLFYIRNRVVICCFWGKCISHDVCTECRKKTYLSPTDNMCSLAK